MKPPFVHSAGFGRADITAWEPGRVMMGWADPRNVARRLGAPLGVRALAVRDERTGARFVYACAELAIVTDRLRDAVVERLRERCDLPAEALMLAATHNHSGPGGFAGYLWYDIPSGGFSTRLFDAIADRLADAVVAALGAMEPATLRWVKGATDLRRVSTNRAYRAYNRNPGVTKVTRRTASEAVDPEMQLLRVDSVDGRPLGLVNWFGLHGTCFHGDSEVVQPDHKGVASALFEASEAPGFVAIFAQGPCGDVTSNARFDRKRGVNVGPGRDDAESCAQVAEAEVEAARRLYTLAGTLAPDDGPIRVALRRERLAEREVEPAFVHGARGIRTTRPIIALGMALGTDEGPGPLHPARLAQRGIAAATRLAHRVSVRFGGDALANVQVPMVVFRSALEARVFGLIPAETRALPTGVLPVIGETLARIRNGEADGDRWLPTDSDVQIARLGSLAIVGVAAEPSTVAGWRLRASVGAALRAEGVRDVVVSAYTNGYCGYLVTPEEHLEQGYESGATVYGRFTLPAWQTVLDSVARSL